MNQHRFAGPAPPDGHQQGIQSQLSSAFRQRSSSLWLSCWVRAASGIWRSRTHLYRLWVLTPRRLENWPDIDEDLSTEGLLRGARAPQAGLRS